LAAYTKKARTKHGKKKKNFLSKGQMGNEIRDFQAFVSVGLGFLSRSVVCRSLSSSCK
jgi:hypothetical protein